MIPELGHFCLAMAVVLTCAQAVIGIAGPSLKDARALVATSILSISSFCSVLLAFSALVWAGAVSDFTVANIAEYSAANTPLLYRITGIWGNHDGSILLWCLTLSLCAAVVACGSKRLPSFLRARVLGVLGLVACGFLLFTLVVSDPFSRIWPPPLNGSGFNPILQDPLLAIHPPFLYIGYVGFSVAFAFAIAALIEGRVDAAWGRWVRPWVLISWCFLTAGITLGSWWSYDTLGWGGFWFWDPVENTALLPWLTGTAFLHCIVVVEKREALKIWAVLLAIITFSLSLSGTFLVRSGILNSVHSFAAAPNQGEFLLVLLSIIIGGSLLLFAVRAPQLKNAGIYSPISRESALILNNIFLCAIAAVIFIGTLYPIFVNLLLGVQLSVGAPFFNQTVLPMALPVIITMGFGPLLPWKRADFFIVLQRLWLAGAVATLLFLIFVSTQNLVVALGIAGGGWVVVSALTDIAVRVGISRSFSTKIFVRLWYLPRATIGAALGHIGFGILIIGITCMTLSVQKIVFLKPGDSTVLAGYSWTLQNIYAASGPNYVERIADLSVSRNSRTFLNVRPAVRFFNNEDNVSKAAIRTNFFENLYTVFIGERDGGAELRISYHPGAPEIWLGGLIMVLGGLCSLSDRRLRIGLPSRKNSSGSIV